MCNSVLCVLHGLLFWLRWTLNFESWLLGIWNYIYTGHPMQDTQIHRDNTQRYILTQHQVYVLLACLGALDSSTSQKPSASPAGMAPFRHLKRLAATEIASPDHHQSFHSNIKGTVQYNGNLSKPFNILYGFNQGYVLVPIIFWIFFAIVLKIACRTS